MTAPSSETGWAEQQAAQWLADPPADPLPSWPAARREALAWALKAQCHAAWSVQPTRAVQAAELLDRLSAHEAPGSVVQALARWCAGLAALVSGRMDDALAALDEAGRSLETLGDEAHAAQTQVPKLIALSMLGRHEDALRCGEAARLRFLALGDDRAAGKIELNLGSVLQRQDRFAEAQVQYQRAAVHFARIGDTEHSIMADIALATCLTWQFAFDDARMTHERALKRASDRGLTVLEGLATGALGQLELLGGQWGRALQHLQAAASKLAGRVAPQQQLDAERHLADAYLAVRLLPEALATYEQVIAEARALNAPVEVAWAETGAARVQALMGRPAVAMGQLEAARAGFERNGNAIGCALVDLQRARLEAARPAGRGDDSARMARAATWCEQAGRHFREAGLLGWACDADIVRAQVLWAGGQVGSARALLHRVRDEAAHLPQRAACDLTLGHLEETAGHAEAARGHYGAAADRFERDRAALPEESIRIAFAGDAEAAFDALVRLTPRGQPGTLLQAMERSRSRSLRDRLRETPRRAPVDADDRRETALRMRLHWLQQQWQGALSAPGADAARARSLAASVRRAEADWIAARQAAAITRGDALSEDVASPAFSADVLRSALPEDTALLAFHLDGSQWRACIVTPQALTEAQGQWPDAAERLAQLRFQLEAPRFRQAALQAHDHRLVERARVHLRRLHDDLLGPLRQALRPYRRWVVVPHRGLHHLPFAALFDGEAYLAEQVEITLAPSAAVWLHARTSAAAGAPAAAGAGALVVGHDPGTLAHVDREVEAIVAALGPTARALTGAQASVDALRRHAPQAPMLHFACHAHARADNPAFSALHLANGQLLLGDLAGMGLRARLVTLSACDTAISRIAPGDEVLGLSRGFLAAGVPSVLASLWSVDDASTAALMGDFYRALSAGQGPATALRTAQCAAVAQGLHPFHWAAFAVHGAG